MRTEEVPFFLALIEHLAERGIPCPRPVRAEDGNALGELADRPAAVVAFLPANRC
ncbi:MAG: phosphotransferase [Alphaproteobacteria bacterium]